MSFSLSTGAIHQPNFLPWLGFFNKVFRVEKFIFFDIVQFPKGKGWDSRVKILLNGEPVWLTLPIKKSGTTGLKTYQIETVELEYNWKKILGTIRQAYLRAPYFNEVFGFLNSIDSHTGQTLSAFNSAFVEKLTKQMGNEKVIFYRTFQNEQLLKSINLKTELIIETCQVYNIENYLSGEGCLDFLEPKQFSEIGINIKFQGFKHPVYPQLNTKEFVPGLSIIDALMNCGFKNTSEMLHVDF